MNGNGKRRLAVVWANFSPYHHARVRALAERFDVTAIELFEREELRGWSRAKAPDGVTVLTLSSGSPHHGRPFSLHKALWRTLREASPQALLAPGYSDPSAIVAALWANRHGVPAIMMTDSTTLDRPRSALKERLKRTLARNLYAAAHVAGLRAADYARGLGFRNHEMAFAYDVVDNDFFAKGAARRQQPDATVRREVENRYFLYVGRLSPEKNLPALLDAFATYRSGGGDWDLVVVGAGRAEAELRDRAAALGLADEIHLLGSRPPDQLVELYAAADAFVLPSLSEPWGLVVNEAMAAGLPVIVSRTCGCVDDLVDEGTNGMLFDPEDTPGLADCMIKMASLPEQDRRRMSERSIEIIANYTPERFAAEVEALLARLNR